MSALPAEPRTVPQSVKDALADAATLSSYMVAHSANPWRTRNYLALCSWPLNDSAISHIDARLAARAAFRAVPALRVPDFEASEE